MTSKKRLRAKLRKARDEAAFWEDDSNFWYALAGTPAVLPPWSLRDIQIAESDDIAQGRVFTDIYGNRRYTPRGTANAALNFTRFSIKWGHGLSP